MRIKSFFIGSLLGDGSFAKKSENHNTYCVFKHASDQYEYLAWKWELLEDNGFINPKSKGIRKVNIKEGSCFPNYQNQYTFSTRSMEELNQYKGMKCEEIVENFDEFSLAIWYLDDGSTCGKTSKISCGSKSEEFCECLVNKINSFGFDAYLYHHPTNPMKNSIVIPARNFEKLKSLVCKYVPSSIDVVKRKFHIKTVIKIKYTNDGIERLVKIDGDKSDWVDMRASETVEMNAGDFKIIPLGVAMELPEGYEAYVLPRSSTFAKWGIMMVNSMGVIDNSYCGDNDIWGFPALAIRRTVINAGDRICQFRITKNSEPIDFIEVESLGNEDRGGYGSTGTR